MPQDLDQTAAPATEYEQMPAVWIALERLLYRMRPLTAALRGRFFG